MSTALQNSLFRQLQQKIERAKGELALTDAQLEQVNAVIKRARPEPDPRGGSAAAGGMRPHPSSGETEGRMLQRLKYALASVVTDAQRSAFEAWKARLESSVTRKRRDATVWVLAPSGDIESRPVRLGLADDDFVEIVGGSLRDGDKVVLRSREAGKQ